MWLRRAIYRWLFPAALVLPLWLLVGWGIFQAGGWVFLWVLFVAVPSVLIGQTVLAFLVRARPSVRRDTAVSWADVGGFALWHVLIIFVGCYVERWFPLALSASILVALGLFWLVLRQLRGEIRDLAAQAGPVNAGYAHPSDVLIITDAPQQTDDRPRGEA